MLEVSNEKSGQLLAKRKTTGKANKLVLLNRFECLSSKEGESMPSPKDAEISLSTKLNNGERSVGSANVSKATMKPQKEYSMKPQIILITRRPTILQKYNHHELNGMAKRSIYNRVGGILCFSNEYRFANSYENGR